MKKRLLSSLFVVCFMMAAFSISIQQRYDMKAVDNQAAKPYLGRSTIKDTKNGADRNDHVSFNYADETIFIQLPYSTDSNVQAVTIP